MYNATQLGQLVKENPKPLRDYKLNQFEKFSLFEYPTWKRLKANGSPKSDYMPFNKLSVIKQPQSGLEVKMFTKLDSDKYINVERSYGVSPKHVTLTEAFNNAGVAIEVKANVKVKEPVVVRFEFDELNQSLLDHNLIVAQENSEVTVVFDYVDSYGNGYHNGVTKVHVEKNAKVTLIQLQNFKDTTTHIHSTVTLIGEEGEMHYKTIDLGAETLATDYSVYLEGREAKSYVDTIYLGDGQRKLDLSYNVYHKGIRTISKILTHGALLDEARKIFRGNLNFLRGAKKSAGSETEYVILLDKRVKADSIPALLCDEDDVQGEHAASAGQINEEQLFYLMSRGLSELEAKKLIIHASFAPVIDELPTTVLKERIENELNRRLINELH